MLCWSQNLSLNERNASTRKLNSDFIELKVKTATQSPQASHASESTGKEGCYYTHWGNGAIDPDYQREIGLLPQNRGKEEYGQNTENPSGDQLVLSCPVINANGKLQQPTSGRTSNGPEPSEINIQVSQPAKHNYLKFLLRTKGDMEWVIEKDS